MLNVLTRYEYKYSHRARDEEEIQTQRASVARTSRKRPRIPLRSAVIRRRVSAARNIREIRALIARV